MIKEKIAQFIRRFNLPVYIVRDYHRYLSYEVFCNANGTNQIFQHCQTGGPYIFGFYLSVKRAKKALEKANECWYAENEYDLSSITVKGMDITVCSESE